jgi:hypothetical protein
MNAATPFRAPRLLTAVVRCGLQTGPLPRRQRVMCRSVEEFKWAMATARAYQVPYEWHVSSQAYPASALIPYVGEAPHRSSPAARSITLGCGWSTLSGAAHGSTAIDRVLPTSASSRPCWKHEAEKAQPPTREMSNAPFGLPLRACEVRLLPPPASFLQA